MILGSKVGAVFVLWAAIRGFPVFGPTQRATPWGRPYQIPCEGQIYLRG